MQGRGSNSSGGVVEESFWGPRRCRGVRETTTVGGAAGSHFREDATPRRRASQRPSEGPASVDPKVAGRAPPLPDTDSFGLLERLGPC